VVLLAFAEPSPVPLVAIKAPRVAAARRAYAVRLRRSRPSPDAVRGMPGVPRLLFCREIDGVPLVGETALAEAAARDSSSPGRPCMGDWVTDWLAALADGAPALPVAHWRDAIVGRRSPRLPTRFGPVVDQAPTQSRGHDGDIRDVRRSSAT
jgi:hypothetical protein